MKIFNYLLSEEIVTYLERLEDEARGYTAVMTTILCSDLTDTEVFNSERFLQYDKIYQEKITAYEFAKNLVISEFIPKFIKINNIQHTWNIDYKTCKFSIAVYTDKCDEMTEEELLHA